MDQTWHLPVETETHDMEVYLWCLAPAGVPATDPLSSQDSICLSMSDQVGIWGIYRPCQCFRPFVTTHVTLFLSSCSRKGFTFPEKTFGFEFYMNVRNQGFQLEVIY